MVAQQYAAGQVVLALDEVPDSLMVIATGGAHPWQPQAHAKPLTQQGLHGACEIQQADKDKRRPEE